MKPMCKHCQARVVNRPRGLCWPCYYDLGIRNLYPSDTKYYCRRKETLEDLERLIAERYPTMPKRGE